MPTNHTHFTAASTKLRRLALDVLIATNELVAHYIEDVEVDRYLAPPLAILTVASDHLQDSIYQAETFDHRRRADDLAAYRALAAAGGRHGPWRDPPRE